MPSSTTPTLQVCRDCGASRCTSARSAKIRSAGTALLRLHGAATPQTGARRARAALPRSAGWLIFYWRPAAGGGLSAIVVRTTHADRNRTRGSNTCQSKGAAPGRRSRPVRRSSKKRAERGSTRWGGARRAPAASGGAVRARACRQTHRARGAAAELGAQGTLADRPADDDHARSCGAGRPHLERNYINNLLAESTRADSWHGSVGMISAPPIRWSPREGRRAPGHPRSPR
jgi:hypothetical protein